MIIATAGHVDHGKTSLVRALTQVDTDRLAEEKRRGMSIDLGFAYVDLGAGAQVGFVDVPGHERFVRNMLAGVAAIDFALLVVAADDGPMPQTLEHVAILDLLGIDQGVVALTKVDRVDPAQVARATQQVRDCLAGTRLAGLPVLPLSNTTGAGVDALRELLAGHARAMAAHAADGHFRLAVDRSFSLSGAGLVVTGAVFSGSAAVGDAVILSPHGVEARIRSIHAQNQVSPVASAGQRCALNLTGADLRRVSVARGDWVLAPPAHGPTDRIDVQLQLLAGQARPLADRTPVQLHLGAASVPARLTPLGARTIEPGQAGFAQLVLDAPIGALHGDRFVIRDASAQHTIAGGRVIDPFAPARGRARPQRLAQLQAWSHDEPAKALADLLALCPDGIELERFEQAWNLDAAQCVALRAAVPMWSFASGGRMRALSLAHWQALQARLQQALANHHRDAPQSVGLSQAALLAAACDRRPGAAALPALRELIAGGAIVRDGLVLREPGHRARLPAADQKLLERVTGVLLGSGLRPPVIGELAAALDLPLPGLREFLVRASETGHLVRVADNRYFLPATLAALVQVARTLAGQSADGSFDAAAYRNASQIGRNLTIELLEFLDRSGITRFAGGRRVMIG